MKPKYLYLALILSAVGFLAFNAFLVKEGEAAGNGPQNDKVIKFSHKVHAELSDCQSCHVKAAESTSLKDDFLPDHEQCGTCHDVEDTNNCNFCHYEDKYEPLKQKKSELIFNHKFHIDQQKLDCKACHKGLEEVDYSFKAPMAFPPMVTCYQCHDNQKDIATNECEACHISTANLRPESHMTVNFLKTHKFSANELDANCAMCHQTTMCEECHVASNVITETNLSNDFYAPYAPHNYVNGARQQKVTKVHDLNYRFTHGIDAKSGRFECQSCHQLETFCAECHNSKGDDFALADILPASHREHNFVMPGVGSGGGLHASEAKKDIESCASCHDTQGGDPTCVTCHLDSDGIKGNNPKTHPRGFMKDVKGDWHDSEGSMCYSCHVSATPNSPAGVGFCGYCHGQTK